MFKPKNAMRHRRIRRLADAIKALAVGDMITHEEIARVAGVEPCPNELFQNAHRVANRESGCYVDSVRGVGYQRRPPHEWEGVGEKYRKRARRQASCGRKFIVNIVGKTNDLSDDDQRRASREIGLLQTVESLTRRVAGQ